ncbi:ATP-dependent DNA helicase [Mucidula mucida]|nr:ATP-dependent DNA helicase [Mucidula mucida]
MDEAHRVLREVFGHDSFRLSQEQVIKRLIVDNDNALVLFPTGGGKSLTYQVPALCLPGLTLVISPLIALMKDQVDALQKLGVKAANLDSTLDAEMVRVVQHDAINGKLKLLYVAPERLNNERFIEMMRQIKISLLAVDESHCISQWGTSFRPEYLKVARFAEEMDVERVLCLTATATPKVAHDICEPFCIDTKEGVFKTPVFRPNLSFEVEVAATFNAKMEKTVALLKKRTGPAIIYVTLQKHAEQVAEALKQRKYQSLVYHAGLSNDERNRVQMEFMASEKGIVCATIAFGMGIDKANIRQIIHLFMPKTLENYSQEVGRAGRDGLPSTCLMFLSAPDIPILEGFARGDTCSQSSLQRWLLEVAMKTPSADGTIDFNHYQQSKDFDMRANVLALCYAHLELQHKCIRAVTPFYSTYDISQRTSDGWQIVMKDTSRAAQALRSNWSARGSSYQIDMIATVTSSGIPREELAKKISSWDLSGYIQSKASQVRARYNVLKPLPIDLTESAAIAKKLFEDMVQRENDGVQRLQEVIEFATKPDCLAHSLATYFGDKDAVPNGKCGQCTYCKTGKPVQFDQGANSDADAGRILSILNACPVRDDPRLLARMAFGITSPRLTANKWSTSNPAFGTMVDVEFSKLVAAFDVECKRAKYVNLPGADMAASSAKKRPYSNSSSSRGNYSKGSGSSRGGSSYPSKRGKYTKRY